MLWTDDFNFLQLITIECFRTSSNNREPVKMITETELSQRITEIVFLVKNYRNSYMPVKNISCNQEIHGIDIALSARVQRILWILTCFLIFRVSSSRLGECSKK
jgi:hypothetical protein